MYKIACLFIFSVILLKAENIDDVINRYSIKGIRIDTNKLEGEYNAQKLNKKMFGKSNLEIASKNEIIDISKRKKYYTLNDLIDKQSELYVKLKEVKQKWGNFRLISNLDKPLRIYSQKFQLQFDEEVNLTELENYLIQVKNIYVYGPEKIGVPLGVPTENTFIPGTDANDVLTSRTTSWYPKHNHKRGYSWHHYTIKTPLAWDITTGSQTFSVIARDIYNSTSATFWGTQPDITEKLTSTDDGNWLIMNTTNNYDTDSGVIPWSTHDTDVDGHGITVLPFVMAEDNNDYHVAGTDTGGMVGSCPDCVGIAPDIGLTSQFSEFDTDLLSNSFVQMPTAQSISLMNRGYSNLKTNIDNGMIVIAAAGNSIWSTNSSWRHGGYYYTDGNGIDWWGGDDNGWDGSYVYEGASSDGSEDYKVIAVAGMSDGLLYDSECNDWWTDRQTLNPNWSGEDRFHYWFNYSPDIDKFNNSTTWSVRQDAKREAFVDICAPAQNLLSIWGDGPYDYFLAQDGTSHAAPTVAGIVGLMQSVSRQQEVIADRDQEIHKSVYNILTFTADKIIDDGKVLPIDQANNIGYVPIDQPEYVLQSNDKLKRWWAQRMGFGKVNAYRAVAHSIANKTPYEINSVTYSLPFANNDGGTPPSSRGYISPNGEQLVHMGSKVSEGSSATYPSNGFWEIPITRGPNSTNDGELNVLDWGGSSIPSISGYNSNSYNAFNNQGVTVFDNTSQIKLEVKLNQILAIDGMVVSKQPLATHRIVTDENNPDHGKILIEGYIRDIEVAGNLRVGDLVIDGSAQGSSVGAGCLWLGGNGTVSEVYGTVDMVNYGMFMGGGGLTTFYPGTEINLLGNTNSVMRFNSTWVVKGGTSFNSDNNSLIVEGGSTLIIDEDQKVDMNLKIYVDACGELIVKKDAVLKIKELQVVKGGTVTIEEGAHISFTDDYHEIFGNLNMNGTASNPIELLPETEMSCLYKDTTAIDSALIVLCNPNTLYQSNVEVHPWLTSNTISCNLPCPTDNSWLVVNKTKDGSCPTDGECEITHELNIPQNYLCAEEFSHLQVTTIFNSSTFNNPVTTIGSTNQVNGIDTCLTENGDYTVTIKLFRYFGDPNPCIITQSVNCDCDCPEESEDWLDITVLPDDPACGPDQCYFIQTLDIPTDDYPCYTHLDYDMKSPSDSSSVSMQSISTFNITAFDGCINEGDDIEVTIKLYKGIHDTEPCIIEKSAYCDATLDEEPCLPDCYSDTFTKANDIQVALTDCPGCFINISYVWRIACGVWQDIQITGIEKYNQTGAPTSACSACSDEDIYKLAIQEVIKQNDMNFKPKKDTCSTQWRVSKASCWTTWTRSIFNPADGGTREITINKPCNSFCCLRRMEVCREGDFVTITNLGVFASDSTNPIICSSSTFQQSEPPFSTLSCTYTCDMLDDFEEVVLLKTVPEFNSINTNGNNLDIFREGDWFEETITEFNISSNNQILRVLTDNNNGNRININLYDINGRLIKSHNDNMSSNLYGYDIDISDFKNGTYLIKIEVDGYTMHTDKFNVTK